MLDAMLERLKRDGPASFPGLQLDVKLPIGSELLNALISAKPPPATSPVKGVALALLDDNRGVAVLAVEKWPLPKRIELPLRVEPVVASGGKLIATIHLEPTGILGAALPVLLAAASLPESVSAEGRTLRIDLGAMLTKKGHGAFVPAISRLEVHTRAGVVWLHASLTVPESGVRTTAGTTNPVSV